MYVMFFSFEIDGFTNSLVKHFMCLLRQISHFIPMLSDKNLPKNIL